MYTYKKANDCDNYYDIFDPEGDFVCVVIGLYDAEALISHLNRK
jgi:hypothetical protein